MSASSHDNAEITLIAPILNSYQTVHRISLIFLPSSKLPKMLFKFLLEDFLILCCTGVVSRDD